QPDPRLGDLRARTRRRLSDLVPVALAAGRRDGGQRLRHTGGSAAAAHREGLLAAAPDPALSDAALARLERPHAARAHAARRARVARGDLRRTARPLGARRLLRLPPLARPRFGAGLSVGLPAVRGDRTGAALARHTRSAEPRGARRARTPARLGISLPGLSR